MLVQGALSSGLAGLTPVDNEAAAISAIVSAWDTYWAGASVNGIPTNPGTYAAGLTAMQGALAGLNGSGAAAAKLQAGITAFWTAVAPLATAIWTTAPVVLVPPITPPPGLGGLAAAIAAAFASNLAGDLSLADAADALAAAIHGLQTGAAVPGSVPPAPPVPIPIL